MLKEKNSISQKCQKCQSLLIKWIVYILRIFNVFVLSSDFNKIIDRMVLPELQR